MKWLAFLFLLPFLGFPQSQLTPVKTYSKDGISVPSFDFKSFEPMLSVNDDTVYVINFWATWCAPCVAEMPAFEQVTKNYDKKKVKVVLVSLDMAKQVESALIPFIKRRKLQSEVIHLHDVDADAWIEKVDPDWSGAIPATLIIKNGSSKFYEQGFTYETLDNEIKKFLINNK